MISPRSQNSNQRQQRLSKMWFLSLVVILLAALELSYPVEALVFVDVPTFPSVRSYHHHHHRRCGQFCLSPYRCSTSAGRFRELRASTTSVPLDDKDDDDILIVDDSNQQQQDELVVPTIASRKRRLTREFVSIGTPALVQLAAEPLAGLVDTAYLGRLGPEVLGGAGVAISAQYAVSKLYNDPLLRTSISLVAVGKAKTAAITSTDNQANSTTTTTTNPHKELSVAVSSALLLAATVGLVQLVVYSVFCRAITISMGVQPTSPMWHSAVSYLQIRALGTPAATLWLVANGIFRGLGDTRTPLLYSFLFTALNAILDPIFIFTWHWGASGAAAGTALAQYIALIPLLRALNQKSKIDIVGQFSELKQSLQEYLKAGGLVLFRSFGKVWAYSVCARQAALLGSVSAAAYNLTFQLGFATTQICEAVAVAVQTLLARELADETTHSPYVKSQLIRHLISTSLWLGGGVATVLSMTTLWRRDWVLQGLTTNPSIRAAAAGIFPVVLLTQVLKGLAYPVNGIIMGGLDWTFSMITMWIANLACIVCLRYFVMTTGTVSLAQLWWALALFMGTQVVAGILRYESKTGVWNVLRTKQSSPQR